MCIASTNNVTVVHCKSMGLACKRQGKMTLGSEMHFKREEREIQGEGKKVHVQMLKRTKGVCVCVCLSSCPACGLSESICLPSD